MALEYLGDHGGNVEKPDPPLQEGGHGHLVSGVECRRNGTSRPSCRVSEIERREGVAVNRLERQIGPGQVEPGKTARCALRIGKGVLDRDAHVGGAQVSLQRSVHELHQGVDDALRMDHHIHPVESQTEQEVGFDDLQTLVHQRGRVDGYPRPHVPGGMGQGLIDSHPVQPLPGPASKRTAGSSQHQTRDLGNPFPDHALEQCGVLRVDRDQLSVAGGRHHQLPTHHQAFLVGQSETVTSLQRGYGSFETRRPHHAVDHCRAGVLSHFHQRCGAGGVAIGELTAKAVMAGRAGRHRHHGGTRVAVGQTGEVVPCSPRRQSRNSNTEAVRNFECLATDGPRRPEDDNGPHRYPNQRYTR